MKKRRGPGGSRKGIPNKVTASMKAAIFEAFDQCGGVPALVKWAKENRSDFYRLCGRVLPREIEVSGKDGGAIVVTWKFGDRTVTF